MSNPTTRRRPRKRLAYTPEEVSASLGVTRRTVYNWSRDGHLRAVRVGSKRLLVPAPALGRLLDAELEKD